MLFKERCNAFVRFAVFVVVLFAPTSVFAATCAGGGLVGYYYSTPEVAVSACVDKATCDAAVKDGTGRIATASDNIYEFVPGGSAIYDVKSAIACTGGQVCCMRENGIDNLCRTSKGGRCTTACSSSENFTATDNCTPSSDGTARHCCIPSKPKAPVVPSEVSCNGTIVRRSDNAGIACPKLAKWKDIEILTDTTTCGPIAYNAREEYRSLYAAMDCDTVLNGKGTAVTAASTGTKAPVSNAPLGPRNVQLPDPLNGADIRQVLSNVIQAFLGFAGAFTFAAFVYAGVMYVFSAGEKSRVESAKSTMKYAAFGIAIILFAYVLTNLFVTALSA